jgi:hypothetical protein
LGGFLYLMHNVDLELVAPIQGDEPPEALVATLIGVEARHSASVEGVDFAWRPRDLGEDVVWHRVWLFVPGLVGSGAVGAALVFGRTDSHAPAQHLVDRVTRELFDAGDAAASGTR